MWNMGFDNWFNGYVVYVKLHGMQEFQNLPSYIFNLTHIKCTPHAILKQAVLSFPVIMAVRSSVCLFGFNH